MRKRRRLANKMTIMVCAVLIAVSAFFYAPMEVSADESGFDITYNFTPLDNYQGSVYGSYMYNWNNGFDSNGNAFSFDDYYLINFDFYLDYISSQPVAQNVLTLRQGAFSLFTDYFRYPSSSFSTSINYSKNNIKAIIPGSVLSSSLQFDIRFFTETSSSVRVDSICNIDVLSIVPLTGTQSASYQRGYNAGYSAGEEAGESNGYSSGYSDGYEAGEQSGYDTGFQAGADSVDTQSYYDAGYQAGYDAGYSSGYDTGYDEGYDAGWSAYEAQMDKWGADTSDYPLEISSGNTNAYFSVHVGSDIPFNYRDSDHWFSSNDYNPNHTYKYVINFSNVNEGLDSDILYDYWDIYLNIGGIEYNITPFQDMSVSVFIPGDRISTSYSFDWVLYNCANYVADDSNLAYLYVDYDFVIYDMGPSGDTQNHIANQTDQLTNGYDDSKGNQVNSDLSTGLNDYETAENSLFATATTGMRDFTFFDFESVPAMITGMSFIGSIMGSWFNQAGGASGVGIVLSILFSVILVAMVLGLYRWYQSRGGKN